MSTREQPEQSYFSSCRVRILLRFEDWGASDAPAPPAKPPQLRTGKKDEAPLVAQRQGGKFVLVPKGSSGSQKPGGPQGQEGAPDDRSFAIEGVLPISCEVSRNGLREADTATIVLSLADFPFDPRAIRSVGVQIFMGCVRPTDFALASEGLTHADYSGTSGDATPLSAVPDSFVDPYGNERSNLRFSGWVDENGIEFSEDDEPQVTLQCVDNTKLLADQIAPPKLAVSASLPIDEAVATYLANFPQCEGLDVEMRPANADRPKLKDALAKSAHKPDLGPPSDGKGTALDYLSDCAMALGLVLWIEDSTVVLQRPRTLYATGAVRPNDPFTGRKLPTGRVLQRRTLVWGVNLQTMGFSRKFGRRTASSIEVRSYSGRSKKTLVARHPGKGQRPTSALPGGATDEKWRVIEVAGIESEEALRVIAQSVYEATGRHELIAKFKTPALGSLGGSNEDPDLLDVAVGDALDIEASRGDFSEDPDDGSSFAAGNAQQPSQVAAYLKRIGYSDDLAEAYAKAVGSPAFPTTFRVKSWNLAFDRGEGIVVSGELMNYVEARLDKELPEGEETPIDPAAGSPVTVQVE